MSDRDRRGAKRIGYLLAEVRYSMPSFGMGVRFLDLRPEDQAFIAQFISQQA